LQDSVEPVGALMAGAEVDVLIGENLMRVERSRQEAPPSAPGMPTGPCNPSAPGPA